MTPYYERNGITIYNGDCLEVMPRLEGPVDAIMADLPYGTTACSWDTVIPFEPLWAEYKRLIKKRGAVVLFGSQPFTTDVINSNRGWFKYEWIWDKVMGATIGLANKMPLKTHENICVFGNKIPVYNPQFHNEFTRLFGAFSRTKSKSVGLSTGIARLSGRRGFPRSVQKAIRPNNLTGGGLHPTQKPVKLMAYLIRTYTNPGDLVLDNTMGSGTTLVAAQNEGRRAIGIEISEDYCRIAVDRLCQPSFFSIPEPAQNGTEARQGVLIE